MKKNHSVITFLILISLLIAYLIYREGKTVRPEQVLFTTAGHVEMCLRCHVREKLDPAHDASVIGCSPCHLGDGLAIDKQKAHKGMVLNPGDLRVAEQTCGTSGCHPTDIHKVKNSLMATNRGILATLLYYWGQADTQNGNYSVEELIKSGENSLALDYYRKLCATCHLWKQKNDLPGYDPFFNEKGGGCSACHYVNPEKEEPPVAVPPYPAESHIAPLKKPHPLISKKVPEENCVRCHNRSGRIGLSYRGQFEAEGYGTPYEEGTLSSRQLPGNRFYLEIADDVHHKKGMACIDCHTRDEIMGDGNNYAHYEDQLEISCEACHDANPGLTRKERVMINISRQEKGEYVLTGKLDGKKRPLKLPKAESCGYPGHKRLTCEACHSTWVPQCYGCHVQKDDTSEQLDKLTLLETKGEWSEGRSYIRYEKPMLAVWGPEIVIVTPGCQDVVNLIDSDGRVNKYFNRFTMAAINPHTTQAKGRSCEDCHASPKTVGLGEGTIYSREGKWFFNPVDRGVETLAGRTVSLDAFVSLEGEALQHASRPELRPFNKEELLRILRVGLCVQCHGDYADPAYRDYTPQTKCPKYREP